MTNAIFKYLRTVDEDAGLLLTFPLDDGVDKVRLSVSNCHTGLHIVSGDDCLDLNCSNDCLIDAFITLGVGSDVDELIALIKERSAVVVRGRNRAVEDEDVDAMRRAFGKIHRGTRLVVEPCHRGEARYYMYGSPDTWSYSSEDVDADAIEEVGRAIQEHRHKN